MRENGRRIAVYSRKSRFTGKGESTENQIELCREFIRAHYGAEAAQTIAVYEDEGFSGGNLKRPDFMKMMDEARKHSFRAIVVYRLDRISRSIGDFAGLIDELGGLGIDFISIREQFDTGSPIGRAMMYIASVFSQLERETIAERIRDNMHELAKTGRWLGGTTPTGYASECVEKLSVDGKVRRACRLRPVPEQAETVRTIFKLYLETGSLAATEAELLRRRVRTKTGREFTRFSVKAILQNPVYIISDNEAYGYFAKRSAELFSAPEDFDGTRGIMAYNRTAQEKGKATVYLPVSEWIVCVGEHPGIIPAHEWIAVQQSLERGGARAYGRPKGNEALLTGLLYCRCGGRMYPKLSHASGEDGKRRYSYVCKRKERSHGGVCTVRNAGGNALDAAVLERIKMLAVDKAAFAGRLECGRGLCTGGAGRGEAAAALRREREQAHRKMTALVDSIADLDEGSARERVAERIAALDAECRRIEERIFQIETLQAPKLLKEAEFTEALRALSELGDCVEMMSTEHRRAAVRELVQCAVWDGEYAQVFFAGAKTPFGEDSK